MHSVTSMRIMASDLSLMVRKPLAPGESRAALVPGHGLPHKGLVLVRTGHLDQQHLIGGRSYPKSTQMKICDRIRYVLGPLHLPLEKSGIPAMGSPP